MKKCVFIAVIALMAVSLSKAEAYFNSYWDINIDGEIVGEAGYRVDNLRWSIQGGNGIPNILSELTFRDVKILEVGLRGTAVACQNIYLRGYIDYGFILDGRTQDSDYLGNNRTLEFSRSYMRTKDDHVFDVSGGIGYLYDVCNSGLFIAPLVGVSYHHQKFRLTHGIQVIDTESIIGLGPIAGLNSTYSTHWNSPWVGLDIGYRPACYCELFMYISYEHHWVNFQASGNWNLREDFVGDFTQRSRCGNGDIVKAGVNYLMCDDWLVGISGNFQTWKTGHGIDRTNVLEEGPVPFPSYTRLNPVHWRSYAIKLDLGYVF